MQTFQQYSENLRAKITKIKAKLEVLESSGLELFVSDRDDLTKGDFETRSYSLANRVEIEWRGGYSFHYNFINFIHDIKDKDLPIVVYCRHEEWHNDKERYAQLTSDPPFSTERHEVESLISFYKQKGVSSDLLRDLRKQVEMLYQQPTPEEVDALHSKESGD